MAKNKANFLVLRAACCEVEMKKQSQYDGLRPETRSTKF